MVFCGDCGASMVRKPVSAGGKRYFYYVCSANKQDKSCSPHRIRAEELESAVFRLLQEHISAVVDLDYMLSVSDTAPLRTAEAVKVQRQLDGLKAEYERLQKLIMSLYENLTDGIIDKDEYLRLKQSFTGRANEAEKQMDALQERIDKIKDHVTDTSWIEEFKKYRSITALDRTVVVKLIDRIMVYEDSTIEVLPRWRDEYTWQIGIVKQAILKEAV